MRRQDRAVSDEEAIALLDAAEYGVLSTVDEIGAPYGVPLSFCRVDNRLYFHCAVEGLKIDCIERNGAVSFCVVGRTTILPEEFSTKYESVIVSGTAGEVFGAEKRTGMEGLLRKYTPELIEEGIRYAEGLDHETRVFAIPIDRLTGKARR